MSLVQRSCGHIVQHFTGNAPENIRYLENTPCSRCEEDRITARAKMDGDYRPGRGIIGNCIKCGLPLHRGEEHNCIE